MQCERCENIQKDPNTGMLICLTCGKVVEETQVVNALEFDDEQKAAGTFMDKNKASTFYPGRRNTFNQLEERIQRNLNKVHKLIENVAKILTIDASTVQYAKKLYNVASNKKFTQGRNTKHIVGAILYLSCRFYKTMHLLIDFSEVLRVNVFIIGSLYIKLARLLEIKIKIIDPSLYMHRFLNKFNFGNISRDIEKTALKILQFMNRDWITTGRRPSGLCGACILISAKLHKLNIDLKLLSEVVHVCPQTIQNRIEEFSLTEVASMSMEQFKAFKETHFYPGSDPPAFLKALKEKEKKEQKIETKEESKEKLENGATISKTKDKMEIENGLSNGSNDINTNINNNELEIKKTESCYSRKSNTKNELKITGKAKSEPLNLRPRPVTKSIDNDNLPLKKNLSVMKKNELMSDKRSLAEEKLSIIPDNEEYKYIYSEEEYGIRKQFWDIMFKDWIEQQREKEEKEAKEKKVNIKTQRKRSKKMIIKPGSIQKTPFEAIKSSNKFGKKINYSYIKSIMSKRK